MTVLMSKELEDILSEDFKSDLNSSKSVTEEYVTITENLFFVYWFVDGDIEKVEFKIFNDDHKALEAYLSLRGKKAIVKNIFSDKFILIEKIKVNFSKNKVTLKGSVLR